MDERSLAVTRRSLHGVAELVLAGPQHGRGGGIRLRVVPGGFGTTVDEVNYGVSPGDDHLPEPYAYVGPWTPPTGAFWNAPFGATRTLAELSDVLEFFTAGRSLLDN